MNAILSFIKCVVCTVLFYIIRLAQTSTLNIKTELLLTTILLYIDFRIYFFCSPNGLLMALLQMKKTSYEQFRACALLFFVYTKLHQQTAKH